MSHYNPAFKSALDHGHGQLAYCMARIAEQQQLLAVLRSVLPEEIGRHIEHCVVSGNKLTLYARSAAWASQIRFFQPAIVDKFSQSGQGNVERVQVRLLLSEYVRQFRSQRQLPSPATAANLIELSAGQSDELSQALSRLGNTLMKRQLVSD